MQKGFGVIYILIGIIIIATAIGGAFYLVQQTSRSQSQNPPENNQKACTMEAKICPDGSSVGRVGPNCEFAECPKPPATSISSEINEFPVYPNSQFVKKENSPSCGKEVSGFAICNSVTYTWQTEDNYDQVSAWFMDYKSSSGWKCSGGAGSYEGPKDVTSKTTCKKDNLVYELHLDANSKKTEIILEIPNLQ